MSDGRTNGPERVRPRLSSAIPARAVTSRRQNPSIAVDNLTCAVEDQGRGCVGEIDDGHFTTIRCEATRSRAFGRRSAIERRFAHLQHVPKIPKDQWTGLKQSSGPDSPPAPQPAPLTPQAVDPGALVRSSIDLGRGVTLLGFPGTPSLPQNALEARLETPAAGASSVCRAAENQSVKKSSDNSAKKQDESDGERRSAAGSRGSLRTAPETSAGTRCRWSRHGRPRFSL
eukprot:scaffold285_cov330-Pavlova_lutheri.AAC.59